MIEVLTSLAISVFRSSSSFLITTAKLSEIRVLRPDTAFPPDSLPSLLLFPVAGALLITKAEEVGSDAGSQRDLALSFSLRPGTF